MKGRRLAVAIAVAVALMFGAISPAPAHADDTEVAIIIGAVVGGLVVVALVATALFRDNPALRSFRPPAEDTAALADRDRIRFGMQCASRDGSAPAIMCW